MNEHLPAKVSSNNEVTINHNTTNELKLSHQKPQLLAGHYHPMEEKLDKTPEKSNDESPDDNKNELFISEQPSTTTTISCKSVSSTPSEPPQIELSSSSANEITKTNIDETTKKQKSSNDDVKQTTEQSNFNANLKSVSMHEIKTNQFNCSIDSTPTDSSPDKPSEDVSENSESSKTVACMAFTIDFGAGSSNVNTQRHNKMLERFQQRHRRGQSLSKLEEGTSGKTATVTSTPQSAARSRTPHSAKLPRKKSIGANTSESSFSSEQDEVRVQVRYRDKSTGGVKDSNKRHSWSPRSSMIEPSFGGSRNLHQQTYYGAAANRQTTNIINNSKRFAPKSNTLSKALESVNSGCRSLETQVSHSGLDSSIDSSLTLSCSDPPLEDIKPPDEDAVSEAGTYTLDGDNYTEEQKEKMNIDNLIAASKKLEPSKEYTPMRPQNLGLASTTAMGMDEKRRKNILEVSYCHEVQSHNQLKSKLSYLDKIKSRVKHIVSDKKSSSKSPDRMIALAAASTTTAVTPDAGCFTSVTTSGILSVKGTLETQHPKIKRKNSLTKSQIDSSEYVQGISKLNLKHINGDGQSYTDLEKSKLAEYKLNIFTKTTNSCDDDAEDAEDDPHVVVASGSVIKTAATKKDWIQEWAKNAREYSTKPPVTHASKSSVGSSKAGVGAMSRSYDFENGRNNQFGYDLDDVMTKSDYYDPNYEEFGDDLDKHYKEKPKLPMDRTRRHNYEGLQYEANAASDTNLKSKLGNRPRPSRVPPNEAKADSSLTRRLREEVEIRSYREPEYEYYMAKPPMSPSKIPSPIHTVGRPRSVSHNRSLCGSNTDLSVNDTEMYLNETAAAISSLQNIHRRNSLRRSVQNSPNSKSPRSGPMSPAQKQSPTKGSPVHSLQSPATTTEQYNSPLLHRQLLHKRNLSLDGAELHAKYGLINKQPLLLSGTTSVGRSTVMTNSLNSDGFGGVLLDLKNKRHNNYNNTNKYRKSPVTSPVKCFQPFTGEQQQMYVDEGELNYEDDDDEELIVEIAETAPVGKSSSVNRLSIKHPLTTTKVRPAMVVTKLKTATPKVTNTTTVNSNSKSSPIRRSSSFSAKPATDQSSTKPPFSQKVGTKYSSSSTTSINKVPIQKSASSTSFKKMLTNYDNNNYLQKHQLQQQFDDDGNNEDEFYINDDDDLEPDPDYSTDSDFSDLDKEGGGKPPITNTRYNKAFLMRIEQSKKAVTGSTGNVMGKQGLMACPNTPEMRRRDINVRGVAGAGVNSRERASMPRDSSLNRMKQDISNLNTQRRDMIANKQQQQQHQQQQQQAGGKVLPKYLDISKYKSPQAGNFLKRDESKSTLVQREVVKRSPSSASVTLSRGDNARTSVRSVKSAGSKPNSVKKDQSAKIKEQELEMWKRRAKYDPMKAAMEGKKKQEEARRTAQQQQQDILSKSCESSSVLRSQSYHSGVGNQGMYTDNYSNVNLRMSGVNQRENVNRWTLTSNESSDFDEEYVAIS